MCIAAKKELFLGRGNGFSLARHIGPHNMSGNEITLLSLGKTPASCLIVVSALLTFFMQVVAHAADFSAVVESYNRKEFHNARHEFQKQVHRGHAGAQYFFERNIRRRRGRLRFLKNK